MCSTEVSELSELSEFINFLKFSFKSKIKNDLRIVFKLFVEDETNNYKTINICMNEKSIDINFIDNNFDIKLVNCVIIIELNTFLTIFNQGIGVFNFLKKIWKKQIKTEKFSYNDYRKFNSCFDFSNKKWDEYYKNC